MRPAAGLRWLRAASETRPTSGSGSSWARSSGSSAASARRSSSWPSSSPRASSSGRSRASRRRRRSARGRGRSPTPRGHGRSRSSSALGGLISGLIVFRFAPEAEGHGTDAAIAAFHHGARRIRGRIPLVKLVASAITIGSGGSGGREGPTAQIGAGFGSLLARVLDLDARDARIAVSTGMGAGIGAIFRAPLGRRGAGGRDPVPRGRRVRRARPGVRRLDRRLLGLRRARRLLADLRPGVRGRLHRSRGSSSTTR